MKTWGLMLLSPKRCGAVLAGAALLFAPFPAEGEDFSAARVERLDNGLTVIALERRGRPVVSVQMLYQVGGRDDPTGLMGLAHFVEHMAFRQSAAFPGTGLVDAIYDVGGEWHGYTWIDQTTYFATAPKAELVRLLDIEAERMDRLVIDDADVAAEIGAVLAEMDGYEDEPDAVILDALAQLAFQIHPYRNNTIGFEGDVRAITPDAVRAFYQARYAPSAAVLAIVGDVDLDAAIASADARFARIEAGGPARLPPSPEPEQTGPRRATISGRVDAPRFKAGFPAPAATDPDFAAFLVLQELLGGGEGVNFHQSDWGVPVRAGSALADLGASATTWFIPSAEPYLFVISGEAAEIKRSGEVTPDDVARALDEATRAMRSGTLGPDALAEAKARVLSALERDVETTEDAAHQIAYFAGLGAFDVLVGLNGAVAAVTVEDVQRAAQRLAPERLNLVWMEPRREAPAAASIRARELKPLVERAGAARPLDPVAEPQTLTLAGGALAILAPDDSAPSVAALVVAPGRRDGAGATADAHSLGTTTFASSASAGSVDRALRELRAALNASTPAEPAPDAQTPSARLSQALLSAAGFDAEVETGAKPRLLVVSGRFDPAKANAALEAAFGDLASAEPQTIRREPLATGRLDVSVEGGFAQDAVGFGVEAPAPGAPEALAYRLALYTLTHEYGGRLGAEAITKQGLVYYISSAYRGDAGSGLITIEASVAADKREAFTQVLSAELERLVTAPPTVDEIKAAKRHLVGRAISAAQSPEEVADAAATFWLAAEGLADVVSLQVAVDAISAEDVREAAARLNQGLLVVVTGAPTPAPGSGREH